MMKKIGIVFCMIWVLFNGVSNAEIVKSSDYLIEDVNIVFQNDEKTIINMSIKNNTSIYYPELFCIPVFKSKEYGSSESYMAYYDYEAKKFDLEPYQEKILSFDLQLPNEIQNQNILIEFNFYSMSFEKIVTKEVYLKDSFGDFLGLLKETKKAYWKMSNGKKASADSMISVESVEMPKLCVTLKSTFKKVKKVYPQYKIYKAEDIQQKSLIYTGYGDVVTFEAQEEKELSLDIPRFIKPGEYLIKLNFIDDLGVIASGLYNYSYTILGETAKICEINFDSSTNNTKIYICQSKEGGTLNNVTAGIEIYDQNMVQLDTIIKTVTLTDKATMLEVPLNIYGKDEIIIKVKVSKDGKQLCEKSVKLKTNFTSIKTMLTDIKNQKCEQAVKTLNGLGIVNGYPDNTYRPANLISRGEFSTMVIKLINASIDESNEVLFSDVYDHWAKQYINTLYKNGFVSGYPDGTFAPDNNVTYAEVITILLNALGYKGEINNSNEDWPYNYIFKAEVLGMISDINIKDYFSAADRGDVAILVMNAYLIK